MAYVLTPAANLNRIGEREYGSGTSIGFAPISSCIGIVSRLRGQNKVIGVHLGLLSPSGGTFTRINAHQISLILQTQGADPATTRVLGEVDFWGGPVFDALMTLLGRPREDGGGSGLYSLVHWDGARVAWIKTG